MYIRKLRLLVTATLLALCGSISADVVDSLLRCFERNADLRAANQLMRVYNEADLCDPIVFDNRTSKDSLRMEVWYWAGEYYYATQRYQDAVELAQRALPLLRASSNHDEEADCLNLLATRTTSIMSIMTINIHFHVSLRSGYSR